MKGWKTWLAAAGGVATGISMICVGALADPLNPDKIYEGIMVILGAVGLIGVGHKIEKMGK